LLLGGLEPKNSWQLSEHLGREKPHGIQRLPGLLRRDGDAVCEEMIRFAAEHPIGPASTCGQGSNQASNLGVKIKVPR